MKRRATMGSAELATASLTGTVPSNIRQLAARDITGKKPIEHGGHGEWKAQRLQAYFDLKAWKLSCAVQTKVV